jgi:hypothetical protein
MNSASLCSLAGRDDNPIPTGFLAPTDCLKITAPGVYIPEPKYYYTRSRFRQQKRWKKFVLFPFCAVINSKIQNCLIFGNTEKIEKIDIEFLYF